ncbi:MAG: PD-(D/E)XK nuclease family protein, partial [Marmoricola sp.]
SRELVRLAVLRDGFLDEVTGPEAAAARAVHSLIRASADGLADGGTAEDALWRLWSGTDWPGRLRRSVELGGGGARRAHRDLDSVVALFDVAAREAEKRDVAAVSGAAGVRDFLSRLVAQQIPADTLAEQGVRGAAVRLLTAHRSKGLEWDLVVVASVQEQTWPDLRRRFSLLEADRLAHDELLAPVTISAVLAEERRLFYVACTRARRRLVVTAVASPEDDGEQPSRFVGELGVEPRSHLGRPPRPLSLAGLVAELRRTVTDPATSEGLRAAAATRLASLAAERHGDRQLVPHADPGSWWGTRAPSLAPSPLRAADAPLRLSASDLDAIDQCPTSWFLTTEAGGRTYSTSAQGVGLIVHALADRIARGDLPAEPGEQDGLMAYVDQVWDQISFRTPWAKGREHDAVRLGLVRFVDWHLGSRGRTLVSTEQRFVTRIDLPGGEQVELRGFADRLEVDADGRLVVVDLKTGKYAPTGNQVKAHVQLGLYQYAANHGAFAEVAGDAECGGAELVQLRASTSPDAKVQTQAPEDPGHTGIEERLMEVAAMIRSEQLTATAGDHCRYCDFATLCPVKGSGTVFDR